jgi:hypothetical protein
MRLAAAWLATAWERIWAAMWLPASVAGLIVALVLIDLLP